MEPDANTNTTVDEYPSGPGGRGGIRLPSSIKEKTGTYITNTLEISSGEEVQDLGADTFLETVEAGWGAEVPEPLDKMLRTVVLVFFAPGSCAETAIYWALPPPRPDTYGSG